MALDTSQEITGWLLAWRQGDQAALENLAAAVDPELRRIAGWHLQRAHPDSSLTTTALVDEAYVHLINAKEVNWQDRAHFFALCARIMRGILVDHARARLSPRRGGGIPHLPLNEAAAVSPEPRADLVAIDEALTELTRMDPRKGRVVELRFFGGMTVEETAEVLGVSPITVMRDWRLAKMWLIRSLGRGGEHAAGTVAAG